MNVTCRRRAPKVRLGVLERDIAPLMEAHDNEATAERALRPPFLEGGDQTAARDEPKPVQLDVRRHEGEGSSN